MPRQAFLSPVVAPCQLLILLEISLVGDENDAD